MHRCCSRLATSSNSILMHPDHYQGYLQKNHTSYVIFVKVMSCRSDQQTSKASLDPDEDGPDGGGLDNARGHRRWVHEARSCCWFRPDGPPCERFSSSKSSWSYYLGWRQESVIKPVLCQIYSTVIKDYKQLYFCPGSSSSGSLRRRGACLTGQFWCLAAEVKNLLLNKTSMFILLLNKHGWVLQVQRGGPVFNPVCHCSACIPVLACFSPDGVLSVFT